MPEVRNITVAVSKDLYGSYLLDNPPTPEIATLACTPVFSR